MTEKYFFDTDCLSAFLWIRKESILRKKTYAAVSNIFRIYCKAKIDKKII